LDQYASSPDNSTYCYSELAISSPAVVVTIASTGCFSVLKNDQVELASDWYVMQYSSCCVDVIFDASC